MRVKFLPKKSIDVEICDIYEDRDAVIVQHTDTLLANTCFNAEALGFKYGLKPCAFHWPYTGIQEGLGEIAQSGLLKFGVYVPTDRWRRDKDNFGYLPDYSATVLSSDGASYYGRTQGEAKLSGFPNNGQELYDYTSGVKGYDVAGGHAGSQGNMDFIREMEFIDQWYLSNFGRLPSTGSDRQGKIGSKEVYPPYYLGIRKTTFNGNVDYYGLSRMDLIHKDLTSRWENGFVYGNKPQYNQYVVDGINAAFANKGLFNDFVHWHRTITYGGIAQLQELYQLIHDTVAGRNAWYTGYSEAIEYYWFRSMVKTVRGSIIDGRLYLIADFDDDYINENLAGIDIKLLYNRIKQPLSVKIDLSGTELHGKALKGANMISLGNDSYIVDIPFQFEENGFKTVVLSETDAPSYKDFTVPTVISNNSGVITTNVPTRAVLFGNQFNQTMSVLKRSNNRGTVHSFAGLTGSKIGMISRWGVTALIDL